MGAEPAGGGGVTRGPGGRRLAVEDLTGESAELYESWRTIGLDEGAALQAVVDAGLAELDPYDEEVGFYMRFANLDEGTARLAVQGRGHVSEVGARAARRRASGPDSPGSAGDSALVERIDAIIDEGFSAATALSRVNVEELQAGRLVPVWLKEAADEAAREVFSGDRRRAAAFGESRAPALLEEKRGRPRSKRKPAAVSNTPGPGGPGSPVTTTEGQRDKPPSRQRAELVESKARLADRVRFFTDVMGLDEASAKVAAAGRDSIEGT